MFSLKEVDNYYMDKGAHSYSFCLHDDFRVCFADHISDYVFFYVLK